MALFDFGFANEAIIALVKRHKGILEESLMAKLAWLQVQQLFPISPFSITKDKVLRSDIVARALGNLRELGYISSSKDLKLTRKGETIFKKITDPFPTAIGEHALSFAASRKAVAKFGNKAFNIKLNASSDSIKLCSLLSASMELGLIFSLPFEKILKNFFPLAISDNEVALYALEKSENLLVHHPSISIASTEQKIIRHHLHQIIPEYDDAKITALLKILLYSLLPYASIYDLYWCGKHEDRDETKNAVDLFTVPPTGTCPRCYNKVVERCVVLENPKIAVDWSNGAFMDWYLSRQLEEAGLKNVFWFCEINNKECDAIGFDQHRVIVVECKRIERYGTEYKKGIDQLRELRGILEATGLKVLTVLITMIAGKPVVEPDTDLVITRWNFTQIRDQIVQLLG
jgi:hypothetical protein